MVSSHYIEHMSVGSGHTYDDYLSYRAGRVANFSIHARMRSAAKVALEDVHCASCSSCALRPLAHG